MSRDLIKAELERAAVTTAEKLDALRQQLAHEDDPRRRAVLSLKIQAAAIERDDCLAALFATPRTL
jgi:hypothetical protein